MKTLDEIIESTKELLGRAPSDCSQDDKDTTWTCSSCGRENQDFMQSCLACRTPKGEAGLDSNGARAASAVVKFCSNCGSRVAAEAKFCASCGTEVASDPADKMHVGWSNPQARSRVTDVQSASQQREARGYINWGVFLIILGAIMAVFGGPVADQAQKKAQWSRDVSNDVQIQYKVGKGMGGGGVLGIVGGVAMVIYGFAKKSDSSGT
jgi:hypothetical protein